MAKQSGLGDRLFVHGYDLSSDVGTLNRIGAPSALLDDTGIDKSAHERMYGLFDGEIAFGQFFNDAAGQEHDALKAKGSGADRIVCWLHGQGIGNAAAGLVSKLMTYDWNRGADGSLNGTVQALANGYGLDYCEQLTAGKRTDTTATDGASLNAGASSANGLVAYLEVFSFTGTSITVKVQESSDDGGSDAFADKLTFTAATAIGAERKATAALTTAIEQYLRVKSTGTFSEATYSVIASRYPVAL